MEFCWKTLHLTESSVAISRLVQHTGIHTIDVWNIENGNLGYVYVQTVIELAVGQCLPNKIKYPIYQLMSNSNHSPCDTLEVNTHCNFQLWTIQTSVLCVNVTGAFSTFIDFVYVIKQTDSSARTLTLISFACYKSWFNKELNFEWKIYWAIGPHGNLFHGMWKFSLKITY